LIASFGPNNSPDAPKVTIVVPVYNVREFLPLCLHSVRAQRYPNLEVIVIDDGSSDGSFELAASFDEIMKLRVLQKTNGGLGAARNTGVDRIEDTDYLLFLDSDDALPLGSLWRYVRAAEKHAVDFVVGPAKRMKGLSFRWRADARQFYSHKGSRVTSFVNDPLAIRDVTAWNRLFRWDFWKARELRFPEGVLYEDMTPMARAYCEANRFFVLNRAVYFWRVRTGDNKSITQRLGEFENLRDRMQSLEETRKVLVAAISKGKANETNLVEFQLRVASIDLQLHLPFVGNGDALYDNLLIDTAKHLLGDCSAEFWNRVQGSLAPLLKQIVQN
jgi:CDP-glycerol glycerophosphotransferase